MKRGASDDEPGCAGDRAPWSGLAEAAIALALLVVIAWLLLAPGTPN